MVLGVMVLAWSLYVAKARVRLEWGLFLLGACGIPYAAVIVGSPTTHTLLYSTPGASLVSGSPLLARLESACQQVVSKTSSPHNGEHIG